MTATITNNGDGTLTIGFAYTADSQKVQDLGVDAAHMVYNTHQELVPVDIDDNPLPFDSLTNQQQLNLLDWAVKMALLQLAKEFYIRQATDAANVQATSDAEARYI